MLSLVSKEIKSNKTSLHKNLDEARELKDSQGPSFGHFRHLLIVDLPQLVVNFAALRVGFFDLLLLLDLKLDLTFLENKVFLQFKKRSL